METLLGIALAALLVGMLGFYGFAVYRRGSLKGAAFDARISSTVGEVLAHGRQSLKQKLLVHRLDRDGQFLVGVELRAEMDGMLPIVLTRSEASRLAALLRQASSEGASSAV